MLKKKILVAVSALAIVLLATPFIGMVCAKPPTTVSGTIELTSYAVLEARPAGNSDNVILKVDLAEDWHGDIEASGTTVATWIIHNAPLLVNPDAWLNIHEKLTFQTFTVMGKSGTVTMELVISKGKGSWTILGGTGELANLHGHGKLTLETTPYTYTGQVHFSP